MKDNEATRSPPGSPPISSAASSRPQETLLQRGVFDPPFTPGTLGRLGRFEILRLLGQGGMGQVYLAREPLTDTRVAIKVMKPVNAEDSLAVHRFKTEARHMYRLSHPRILRVLELSERKAGPYYVMPFIEDGNLLAQFQPDKLLPDDSVLSIARQVAEALAHAHAHGLIHRDLKPGNVLVDKEGNAFLTDFGLVRTADDSSVSDPDASHLDGTAPYMSPALARGEAEDTRCDIYALGALLYELLTGQPPYGGRTAQIILNQILKGPPPPIRSVNPKANPALARIAETCMARELRDRYAAMADVIADLDRAAKGTRSLGNQNPTRHRLYGWAAALLIAAVAGGLGGVAVRRFMAHGTGPSSTDPSGADSSLGESQDQHLEPEAASGVSPHAVTGMSAPDTLTPFAYTTNNGEATVTGYTGRDQAVTIPATIDGLPVTGIGDAAFTGVKTLTRIEIPASVAFIGTSPFSDDNTLMAIRVNAANPAFSDTDGVLFDRTRSRLISFPGGRGGNYEIPNGVTSIRMSAFVGAKVSRVVIPATVTTIGDFQSCGALTSIIVSAINPRYSGADGILFNKQKTALIACPRGKAGAYEVPEGITIILASAFRACTRLTGVTVPASVRVLGPGAFRGCERLAEVYFKGDSPTLGEGMFSFSERVTVYYLPGTKGWEKEFGGRPTAVWKNGEP